MLKTFGPLGLLVMMCLFWASCSVKDNAGPSAADVQAKLMECKLKATPMIEAMKNYYSLHGHYPSPDGGHSPQDIAPASYTMMEFNPAYKSAECERRMLQRHSEKDLMELDLECISGYKQYVLRGLLGTVPPLHWQFNSLTGKWEITK
jgi:hypothetical protein